MRGTGTIFATNHSKPQNRHTQRARTGLWDGRGCALHLVQDELRYERQMLVTVDIITILAMKKAEKACLDVVNPILVGVLPILSTGSQFDGARKKLALRRTEVS